MKFKEKCFVTLFAILLFVFILNVNSYAGSQEWNSLNYDATLNSDGSMDVVETWNIDISNTNTLFKDFEELNITNVSVSLVDNGKEYSLEEIYEMQYHVDEGCYYALEISDEMFEIAWNVGLDNSSDTRIYKLCYIVPNAITVYNDCAELYWQFLGDINEIPGKNITGTIHLPSKVSDIEKLRVWAHGDLSGEIERTSTDTVNFSVPSLDVETMLEIRVVTEENIYEECTNISNTSKLDSILEEEQELADEANAQRRALKIIEDLIIIINIVIVVFFTIKIKKYLNERKIYKDSNCYGSYDIDYFRDIPDEKNATPARAKFMVKHNKEGISSEDSDVFSATLLDISLKGIIEFELVDKNNIKIILKDDNAKELLLEDEYIIYLVLKIAADGKKEILIKDFEKFAKGHYNDVIRSLKNVTKAAEDYEEDSGKIDEERKEIVNNFSSTSVIYFSSLVGYLFATVMTGGFAIVIPTLPIMCIICGIVLLRNAKYVTEFSEAGYRERQEWFGLKKYMEDYSLLKERDVPDIVLWEKYLVYATTFGISKKVLKNLKVVHPEMFNDEYIKDHPGYWHIVCNNHFNGIDSFEHLNHSLASVYRSSKNAYSAAHSSSSSGSGGGGGFSGGGGGRRRWRWLPEVVNPRKFG